MKSTKLYEIKEENLRRVYEISLDARDLSNKKLRKKLLKKIAKDVKKTSKGMGQLELWNRS